MQFSYLKTNETAPRLQGFIAFKSECVHHREMKQKTYAFFLFIALTSCATSTKSSDSSKFAFTDTLTPNTAHSLQDYLHHQKLENGIEYGSFVRNFHLAGESVDSAKKKLSQAPCTLKEDVIREPKHNLPIRDRNEKTAPIWVWLCEDGGIIRIKPQGDPTNKFRPEPHGSKALRYPPTGEFHGFNDETLKIDEAGNPLPKWPADLKSKDPTVINDWANATHTDLK